MVPPSRLRPVRSPLAGVAATGPAPPCRAAEGDGRARTTVDDALRVASGGMNMKNTRTIGITALTAMMALTGWGAGKMLRTDEVAAAAIRPVCPSVTLTANPSAGRTPNPSTAGSPQPYTLGTPNPSTVGTPNPSTVGTPNPSTAGTPNPSAAGSPCPSAVATPRPSVAGTACPATGAPRPASTPTPSVAGTACPTASATAVPNPGFTPGARSGLACSPQGAVVHANGTTFTCTRSGGRSKTLWVAS
jgi:hypothetical protein